jgi:hypothetical protein
MTISKISLLFLLSFIIGMGLSARQCGPSKTCIISEIQNFQLGILKNHVNLLNTFLYLAKYYQSKVTIPDKEYYMTLLELIGMAKDTFIDLKVQLDPNEFVHEELHLRNLIGLEKINCRCKFDDKQVIMKLMQLINLNRAYFQ